jgi:hypothetical protein
MRIGTRVEHPLWRGTMIARVAVWEPLPDDDRQWVIDAAKTVSGVLDACHLVDPNTGNGLSIALFDDDVEVAQVKAAIARKAEDIGWDDVPRPAPKSENDLASVATRVDAGSRSSAPTNSKRKASWVQRPRAEGSYYALRPLDVSWLEG